MHESLIHVICELLTLACRSTSASSPHSSAHALCITIATIMALKFGLNIQKNLPNGAQSLKATEPARRKTIFDEEEDEDGSEPTAAPGGDEILEFDFASESHTTSKPVAKSSSAKPEKPIAPLPFKPKAREDDPSSRVSASEAAAAAWADEALAEDPSLFDYDAAYDALHAQRSAKAAADRQNAAERQPRYMNEIMASADVRKRDFLRAKEKLLQREREAEGDAFADKETFVTDAWKAQKAEMRKAEEEETRLDKARDERKKEVGMRDFYRHLIDDDERRHKELMDAAALGKDFKVEDAPAEKEKSGAELAEEMKAKGKNIVLTDDGQVVDKRELLTAGLNVVAKPKPAPSSDTRSAARPEHWNPATQARNEARRAMRERHSRMVQQQLGQTAKRAADDEAEEQRKLQHAAKSQKTEAEIGSARERYLQRKREAASAKAK